jgi:acetyl-CoA synthetase
MSKESIDVLSTEKRTFPPSAEFSRNAHIKSMEEYEGFYRKSIEDPDAFWAEMAEKQLTWYKKWDKVSDWDFKKPYIKWFVGGKLNAAYNCLDRFMNTPTRNKAAIIWEADDGTYRTLHLPAALLRSKQIRQCTEEVWGRKGRQGNHLSADDT